MPNNQINEVPYNHEALKYVREKRGLSREEVARRVSKSCTAETIEQWENGEAEASYAKLETLAKNIYKVSLITFFYPEPPELDEVRASFRSLSDDAYGTIPIKIAQMIADAQVKVINLKELSEFSNIKNDTLVEFLRSTGKLSFEQQVFTLRQTLGITLEKQKTWKNSKTALKYWRAVFERIGIFVFKNAFRNFDYSGFCIFDSDFPIMYLNNSMPETRQIFTLFHEMYHLFMETSGIDKRTSEYMYMLSEQQAQIERNCNRFASEFLVPTQDFKQVIMKYAVYDENVCSDIADLYSVSREVALRKLLEINKVTQNTYDTLSKKWVEELGKGKVIESSGGNYYNNQISYMGTKYINTVFQTLHQGKITRESAAEYIGTTYKALSHFDPFVQGGLK